MEHLQQCFHDFGIASDDVAAAHEVGVTTEVCDQAARLLDQQRSGCHVPGLEPVLPETIEASRRNVRKIECRGASAADTGGDGQQGTKPAQVIVEVAHLAEREAGAKQAAFQALRFAYTNAPVIELGATAAGCGEKLLSHRVVDDALFQAAFVEQPDGHGEYGKAVEEVGGAIEGVNDPLELIAAL